MITSLNLTTTLLSDVSRRGFLYLNCYVTKPFLDDVGAPRAMVPFTMDPILLDMEGGSYVEPLLLYNMSNLLSWRHGGGGNSSKGRISRGGSSGHGVGVGGIGSCRSSIRGGGRDVGRARGAGWVDSGAGTGGA